MKKNGFIATSVLYSFFIVFITLFVALIANFIHNRVLIENVDEESLKVITESKSTKISDLVVGDKVRLSNNTSNIVAAGVSQPSSNLINEKSTWVVADIEEDANQKIYYLLSDMKIGSQFTYKRETEMVERTHTITIDIFNEIKNMGLYDQAFLYNISNPDNKIEISIPTISVIRNASRNADASLSIKNSIFNTSSNFTVYADVSMGSYVAGNYYNMRYYTVPKNASASAINSHCKGSYNGTNVNYNSENIFGYLNVGTDAKKTTKYINYCLYADPLVYNHNASDKIIHADERNITDKIASTASLGWDLTTNSSYEGGANAGHDIIGYNIRLMAKIVVKNDAENVYISGGKGTSIDPYLITNGQQGRYQSSKDKINLTSNSLVDIVMRKANFASVKNYNSGNTGEAYTFSHPITAQTGDLIDYRYLGANPNNYVIFNGEVWRIIGVFNQDGENRVKLVRNEGLTSMQWSNDYHNDWSLSMINDYLNNTYYNSLPDQIKNLIASSTYYLGGVDSTSTRKVDELYSLERGYDVIQGRRIRVTSKIGLMYISDYYYTYANNVNASCFNDYPSCTASSWINNGQTSFFITPYVSEGIGYSNLLNSSLNIITLRPTDIYAVRPVLYLKNGVEITGGMGTQLDPYQLKIA